MARQLEGLYDPKTGAVGMAKFSVMMMRKLNGHITSRQEILDMQDTLGREWTEEEIKEILKANGTSADDPSQTALRASTCGGTHSRPARAETCTAAAGPPDRGRPSCPRSRMRPPAPGTHSRNHHER